MKDKELDELLKNVMKEEEDIPLHLVSKIEDKVTCKKINKTLIIVLIMLSWISIIVEFVFITSYSYSNPLLLLLLLLFITVINISSGIILFVLRDEITYYVNNNFFKGGI